MTAKSEPIQAESEQVHSPLREQKKAHTREAVVQAANTLFTRDGFENVTVDQIAVAAGISRRTFFRYFPVKEAVVFPENEDRLNAFIAILEANSQPETPLNGLDVAVMTSAAVFSASKEVQLAQFKLIQASPTLTAYELQIDAGWEERIAASWIKQLGPRPSAKKRLWVYGTAGSAMGMIRAVLRYWYVNDCQGDLETFAAVGELEAKPSIYALAVVGPVLFAARGDGEAVVAWDMATKARADAPPYAAESLLAVGKKLYLGRDDGSISVWDASRATPLPAAALEHGHDGCVTALASMAGAVVVSGGEDGAVVCWDAAARTRRWATRPREGAVNGADAIVADDSGCLFSASPMAPHVQVWSGRNRPDPEPEEPEPEDSLFAELEVNRRKEDLSRRRGVS